MKVLLAPTEDFIKRERTKLSADAAAGSGVTLNVLNSDGYAVNDYIVVGFEGSEQAEIAILTAVTGETLTATLKLSHKQDEPIVKYRYNKRKFYGSLSAGGSYAELTSSGSPALIGVDDPQGTILEYTGGEGYLFFKSTYFNSTTSEESNIADANEVNADETLRYCSLYAIRKQAGLTNNPYITDGIVETYRKRAENEVKSYLLSRYTLPLQSVSGVLIVPAVIENVTTLLAAGYMDYQEFGKDGEGVKWLGEARGILNAIKKGNQRLLDANDQELAYLATSNQMQGYPDQVDDTNGPAQYFKMGQRF